MELDKKASTKTILRTVDFEATRTPAMVSFDDGGDGYNVADTEQPNGGDGGGGVE